MFIPNTTIAWENLNVHIIYLGYEECKQQNPS